MARGKKPPTPPKSTPVTPAAFQRLASKFKEEAGSKPSASLPPPEYYTTQREFAVMWQPGGRTTGEVEGLGRFTIDPSRKDNYQLVPDSAFDAWLRDRSYGAPSLQVLDARLNFKIFSSDALRNARPTVQIGWLVEQIPPSE